jgi:cysteine desulfurase family protein
MIYLNNASTSYPKPKSVLENINEYLNILPVNYGRSGNFAGNQNILNSTRIKILDFFHANTEEYYIVFTSGSTEALNLAIQGLDLIGKHVISSAADHNSVLRPLIYLEKIGKIELTLVECDSCGLIPPENIKNAVKSNTSLIVINHVSNVTGVIQNVEEITAFAKSANVLVLLDGSQASGNIEVNIDNINCDFYAFTGHKSLYGLQGSGGLIFRKKIDFKPLKYGGTGFKSDLLDQPDSLPHKYEAGTLNMPGIISLSAGIDFINQIGIDNIKSRKKNITQRLLTNFEQNKSISVYFDKVHSSFTVLSFNIKEMQPEDVNYILSSSFDIESRSGLHCCPLIHKYLGASPLGTVRFSPSFFTTDVEVDIAIKAINQITDKAI